MKIKILILLLLGCGLATMSTAQCPTASITLDSQTAIDNFSTNYPGCTTTSTGVSVIIEEAASGTITNLDGLSQLTSVGADLYVRNNDVLANVDGLSQLTSIGNSLSVSGNAALTNVNGLSQLTSVGGGLLIVFNAALNQCCALCPLLAADAADPTVIGQTIAISNNLTGCASPAQINECNTCGIVATSMPEYAPAQLNVYPNPAQDILHFQYENSKDELIYFTIKNYLGQQFIQNQVYTNQSVTVDISDYPAGMYFLNVLKGDESMSRLFSVSR